MYEFSHDYLGRRVEKKVSTRSGSSWTPSAALTERYVWDAWNVVMVLNGNNVTQGRFTWGLDLSGSPQGAGGIGGLLAWEATASTNSPAFWYFYDGNGNVGQLIKASDQSTTATYEYDPYGNIIVSSESGLPSGTYNPFRFSTKWFDESGLGYWGYRYYSPRLGRWMNRDPIEERGGIKLYGFLNNDPLGSIDPLGQMTPSSLEPALQMFLTLRPVYCCLMEHMVAAIVAGHTDTAWRNFTGMSERKETIDLSESDMDLVINQYFIVNKMITPLVNECKKSGDGWTDRETTKGLNGNAYYYGDSTWGAALGGVSFSLTSTCEPSQKQLTWTLSIDDSWDFDNWRSNVTQLPRNIIVLLIQVPNIACSCGWKNFNHKGMKSGTTSW